MKASILAIGTELTSGQITNKNATTLSERLSALGIDTVLHQTVPDHRRLIQQALQISAAESELIFVTGGLGPTSDDFTRDSISEFTGQPLVYDENAWNHIVDRLSTRGFKVREMQKQQCYFPEGSTILTNKEGTAHGFRLQMKNSKVDIIVLPGPPREIDSIWKDHLASWLAKRTEGLDKKIVKSWDTIGVGESDIAYGVQEILNQFKDQIPSDLFEVGYRVHLPYVETKIIFNQKHEALLKPALQKIDQKLSDVTVLRDQQDIVQIVTEKLKKTLPDSTDFTVYDMTTTGFLHNRLLPLFRQLKNWGFRQSVDSMEADFFTDEDQFLALLSDPHDEQMLEALVLGSVNGKRIHKVLKAPMDSPLMKERRQQYFAEMALIEFNQAL